MANGLENRVDVIVREINKLEKKLVLQKSKKANPQERRIKNWKSLGKNISAKWDSVSVSEELSQQREKTW
jgi:hypothetical protein